MNPRDVSIDVTISLTHSLVTGECGDHCSEAILSACVFQGNVVEDVVHSGQKMAEEALLPVK